MTLRECAEIAMRECGVPEDEIKRRVAFANGFAPAATEAQVAEGLERQLIEGMKTVEVMRKLDPDLQQRINRDAMNAVKRHENN